MITVNKNTEKDPINYLSKVELEVLGESVKNMSTTELMDLRQQVVIIKNQYRTHAFKQSPATVSIFENATVAKVDVLNTKRSATGMNFIAKRMAEEGKKEATTILEKFSQNHYGDKLLTDIEGLNPFKSFREYNEFEEKKPNSVRIAETIAQNEDQYDRLQQRVGTTAPAEGSNSILDRDKGYLSNFKDKEAALALLKSCIPCDLRIADFSLDYTLPWLNTIKDINQKWKDLIKMLRSLSTFRAGEFSQDLCNLFKFLDGQCIPDITGLMSLLSLMQLKYMDLGLTSLNNIINQLIAPFLSPIIGSFTSNLDQYVDLIVKPLKCVAEALEKQVINVQEQINGAYNIADMNRTKYKMAEIEFYDKKIKALTNRKLAIANQDSTRLQQEITGTFTEKDAFGNTKKVQPYTKYSEGKTSDLGRQENIIKTKLIADGIRIGGQQNIDGTTDRFSIDRYQLSNNEEIKKINEEIRKLEEEKKRKREKLDELSPYKPINFNGAISITRATQDALGDFERSFKSIIGDLTDAINDGVGIIQQSVDIYREEFQRLLLGRVTTQQDQLEFTRLIQQIARLGSIVKAVSDFKKAGMSLKDFCEKGEANAMAQVAKGIKQNDSNNMFDFYQAQDSDGNPLMVIAPGGATVNVSSIDFNGIGDDALFADASINLDAVTKTVSFNDLNEVDKLNREGIVPDLGNIDGKQIELSNKTKVGSELDLHFKTSYAIISSEFCSKSAITFGSSDTVKQWAAGLWQKN